MSRVALRPRLSPADAVRLARARFGIDALDAAELDAERDQNFRVSDVGEARWVLKISNPAEDPAILEAQRLALEHLARAGLTTTPRVRLGGDGSDTVRVEVPTDAGPRPAIARVLSWIDGQPMATVTPRTDALFAALGRALGEIDRALADFDHPAVHRTFEWSADGMLGAAQTHLPEIAAPADRDRVARRLERFARDVAPRLGTLPRQVLHGDANDWNVMVDAPRAAAPRIAGLVDFGDLAVGPRVAEPAIAAAYAAMGRRDPVAATAALVRGYHAAFPLGEGEADVLWELVGLRLCLSVAMAAHNRAAAPDVAYLSVSEAPAWALLRAMDEVHPRLARYSIRDACGLEPCPGSGAVSTWLAAARDDLAPILPVDPSTARLVVVDLSVDAPPLSDDPEDTAAATRAVERAMEDAGAEIGVGRYDEVRVCYDGDLFATEGDDLPERRTVHLGVDLFVPAGTNIHAPLAGEVVGLRDNAGRLDYGPTVILRHDPDGPPDRPAFETLWGHLDPACLETLRIGQRVARGEAFAAVGAPPRNGDWPPHVHAQVVVDRLDRDGEFPGVAAPSTRALWRSLSPSPLDLARLPDSARAPEDEGVDVAVAARRARIGPSLSVAYRRAPLKIVRGRGAYLFDAEGRAYLDGVNNVCHVGHAHPRVVRAIARQAAILNTNTRYLHDLLLRYGERLLATLPPHLEVVFLTCSGSEANELALRIARAATGRRDLICQDAAYHGNTQALIDVSPYKHAGPGGEGPPPHVHVAPLPDPYRGRHRADREDAGAAYAEEVERIVDALMAHHTPPAALLAESLPGCGGQIVPPDGYLRRAFEAIRAAGGVAIADEVQTGMGRVGSHFWAFQAQDAVPDVVTVGKPIGNGHPLAAVATTRALADAFANGMEYFNTFGGNPVSCAAGLAVLDVIEEECLQAHAREVGAHLLARLTALQERHEWIGDVRGLGLYLGVELVEDRESRASAPDVADHVVQRMRARGVLLSTDGPDENVLKIKPPLVFSGADADRLVEELDAVLGESAFAR